MFHLQNATNGWLDAIRILPPGATVKSVMRPDLLRDAKQVNPGLFTVLRHWNDGMQHYDGNANYDVWIRRAREWFLTHIDGTFEDHYSDGAVDAVSWHNEIWAESQNDNEKIERVVATRAACDVWNNEFRNKFSHDIKLIVGEAAVGNSMPVAVASIAEKTDNLLGYHPYMAYGAFGAAPKQRWAEDWRWLSGRWAYMDDEYGELGVKPTWIFTEAGPFQSVMDGWRSSKCLGADQNLLIQALRTWIGEIKTTRAYSEGRVKGFHLYTTGGGEKWHYYEVRQPEMSAVAQLVREEWTHVDPPPPPPDPKKCPDVGYVVVAYLMPQAISLSEAKAIGAVAFHEQKRSIVYSADDAARLVCGGRPGSHVVAYAPERWGVNPDGSFKIVAWLKAHGVAEVLTRPMP